MSMSIAFLQAFVTAHELNILNRRKLINLVLVTMESIVSKFCKCGNLLILTANCTFTGSSLNGQQLPQTLAD